jgi:sugar phosphate permease
MAITLTKEYRSWRYRVFALSWLAYAGFYLCRKNFSIAMPLLNQDLGFTKGNFAVLLFCYNLFYALGQFYNGFLSDKFGPRLIVGIGLFLSIFANIFDIRGNAPGAAAIRGLERSVRFGISTEG